MFQSQWSSGATLVAAEHAASGKGHRGPEAALLDTMISVVQPRRLGEEEFMPPHVTEVHIARNRWIASCPFSARTRFAERHRLPASRANRWLDACGGT